MPSRLRLFYTLSLIGYAQVIASASLVNAQVVQNKAVSQEQSTFNLTLCIIDNLIPKPVPFTSVIISGQGVTQTLQTDANGQLSIALAPGIYHIQTPHAISYHDHLFTWSKDIVVSGKTMAITLTDADAQDTALTPPSTPTPHNGDNTAGHIFRLVGPEVVSVLCDFGHGSGFVVDKSGLILTNAHVVNNTSQVAVRFGPEQKYPAVVLLADKEADVAVIRVNPSVLPPGDVVNLQSAKDAPNEVGDQVFAIGWPLDQDRLITEGIVSRVNSDTIISDININHGNSGGPLLNTAGKAIGITTFLDTADNGPGISGIITINKAFPILDNARQMIANQTAVLPPSYALPDPGAPIPPSELEQAQNQDLKAWKTAAPKNFAATIYTPYVIASIENTDERQMERGKSHRVDKRFGDAVTNESESPVRHFWDKYVGEGEPAVTIIIEPEVKEKSSSIWSSAVVSVLTEGEADTKHRYEYRDNFYDMQLYRGNDLILPLGSNRANMDTMFDSPGASIKDEAYAGIYNYAPSAFEPSKPLTIKMRRESNLDKWDIVQIDQKTQEAIWNQFAGYRIANPDADVPQIAPLIAQEFLSNSKGPDMALTQKH